MNDDAADDTGCGCDDDEKESNRIESNQFNSIQFNSIQFNVEWNESEQ
jgi:hypothetical protein